MAERAIFRSTAPSARGDVLERHEVVAAMVRELHETRREVERDLLKLARRYPDFFDVIDATPPGTRIVAVDVRDYEDLECRVFEARIAGRRPPEQANLLRREFYCPCEHVWEELAEPPLVPEASPLPERATCPGCGQEHDVVRLYAHAVVIAVEARTSNDSFEVQMRHLFAEDPRLLWSSGAFHLPPRQRDDPDFDVKELLSHGRALRGAEEWEGE